MTLELDIESSFNLISIIVSAFLGFHFMFLKDGNKVANRYLGLFLLLTSVSVLGAQFYDALFGRDAVPVLIHLIDTAYLTAPILLFYALSLTRTPQFPDKYLKFFIPAAVEMFLLLLINFTDSETNGFMHHIYDVFVMLSLPYSLFVYVLILRRIKAHNNNMLAWFSSIENKQLDWLRLITMINIGFLLIWIVDDSLDAMIGPNPISAFITELSLVATLVNVLWMGFAGLRQPLIFEDETVESEASEDHLTSPALEVSNEDQAVFNRVVDLISRTELYKDSSLSLKSLSIKAAVRDKELSRLINQCHGNNFYHFINSFRVDHFKQLFSDDKHQHLSIMGMAIESGFKSKTTFYDIFKKLEGLTPTEFKAKQAN